MLNLDLNTLYIHTENMVEAVLHFEDGKATTEDKSRDCYCR
jgi:hypothetical protein